MCVNGVSMIVCLPSWLITVCCGRYGLYTLFWLLLYGKRLKNTWWQLCKWNKLLLSWRMWQEYPVHICLYRLPSPGLWMVVIKHHIYYQRCKTKNRWRSVDAHFQHGVGSVLLSLFAMKAANTMFLTVCNLLPPRLPKIHDHQLLMLRWPSFSGCGRGVCLFILITKAANTSKINCDVPMSILHDYQYYIWMWPSMRNPKHTTGDRNWRVWPNPAKPADWWVWVRVWTTKSQWVGSRDRTGTEPTCFCGPNLGLWRVTWTSC